MTEKIIYAWLKGCEHLPQLVGDRIYTGHAPQGTHYPFLVIRLVNSDRVDHLLNEANLRWDDVEIEACSLETDEEAEAIGRVVWDRMAGSYQNYVTWKDRNGSDVTTLIHGANCSDFTFIDEGPTDNSDNWHRGCVGSYRVAIDQVVPTHT